MPLQEEYVTAITKRLKDCNDLELLEIILQLLQKSKTIENQ